MLKETLFLSRTRRLSLVLIEQQIPLRGRLFSDLLLNLSERFPLSVANFLPLLLYFIERVGWTCLLASRLQLLSQVLAKLRTFVHSRLEGGLGHASAGTYLLALFPVTLLRLL